MKFLVVLFLLSLQTSLLHAGIFVPDNVDMPLVKVSQSKQLQLIRNIREQLKDQPDNVELVSEIIQQYMKLGREQAEERYFSYAETFLKPYLGSNNTNVTLLLQWADILQRQHRFDQAKAVLGQVLKNDRHNARAHLMRSVIYQAQGDLDAAMDDCKSLLGRAETLVVTTCLAQVSGLQGRLSRSIKLLETTLERYQRNYSENPEVLNWSRTVLAEMLVRSGKPDQAMLYLNKINKQSSDFYALSVVADILIQQQRYKKVITLLEDHKHVNKLLLRYAIAAKRLGRDNTTDINRLKNAMKATEKLNDNPHKRMLARYYLDIENDPVSANKVATQNWKEQKEPEDALILVRSMQSANDKQGLSLFRENFIHSSQYDVRVDAILNQVKI